MIDKTFQTSLTNQGTLEWGTFRGGLIHDPEPNPEVPKNTAPRSSARHFTVESIAAWGGLLKSYLQRNTVQELCLFALGVVPTFPLNPSSLNLPYIIKTRSTCRIVETRCQVRSVLYSQIKGERKRIPSQVCIYIYRERETYSIYIERERETDRQTDRQTETDRDRETERIVIKHYSLTRVKLTALYKQPLAKATLTYIPTNRTLKIVVP